jgi:hypothetical protein
MKIGCLTSILLLRSNLSSWPSLSICEQNETRKTNHGVIIIFVDYKSFFSLEVSNPDLCRLEAAANPSVLSALWVDFLSVCPTWSDIMSGCKGALNMVRKVYIIHALPYLLKYISLDKKHYFNVQPFVCWDILSLDRQYAENNLGIRVISCNCVTVAV